MTESRTSFLLMALVIPVCVAIVGGLGFLIGRASVTSTGNQIAGAGEVATEDNDYATRPPVEAQAPPVRVEPERRPVASPIPIAPTSPGVTFAFDDIERACGDIYVPSFLCLVNRGGEQIAGGSRLVIDESLASFTSRTNHGNSISINVEGKQRYSLDFAPPKGKALVLGLYTGATRWPFNQGPYPGIDVGVGSSGCNEEEGQFRVLELQVTGDSKVRRFVADFETTCNGAIGRVAVGQKIESWERNLPLGRAQ